MIWSWFISSRDLGVCLEFLFFRILLCRKRYNVHCFFVFAINTL